MAGKEPLPLSSAVEVSVGDIADAWAEELSGVPVNSIRVITTLWRTAKLLTDDRSRTLRNLGIDAATLDLLSTLRRAGEPYRLTTRTLAERCLVSAGAVSQRVARAEAEGLVVRESARQGRKSVAVTLTEAGHRLLEPAVSELLGHEAEAVSDFSAAEQRQLVELLERLGRAVSRL